MPEINYIASKIGEGNSVTTKRRVFNRLTQQYEEVQRTFQVVGTREDGSLELVHCSETFSYNNASYAVQYVGPNRR